MKGPWSLKKICSDFENKIVYPEFPGVSAISTNRCPKTIKPYFDADQVLTLVGEYNNAFKEHFGSLDLSNTTHTLHQKICFKENAIVHCIGDIHGSVHSLLRDLYNLYKQGILNDDFTLKKNHYLLCTGDYIDRGLYSIEVILILLILKLKNWDQVFLGRGNHEEESIFCTNGFLAEAAKKYNNQKMAILKSLNGVFQTFAYAHWIQAPEHQWILSTHGGFDPDTLKKVHTQLLNTDKTQALIVSNNNEQQNEYAWYDFSVINNKIYMSADKRDIDIPVVEDVLSIMEQYNIVAILRGHQHSWYNLKFLTFTSSSLVNWKTLFPNQTTLPLSLPIPIFTLSTATEIEQGPQKASYVTLSLGNSIKDCTIAPVEIDFKPNQIIED